jgi:hypothetical protein
MSPEKLCCPEAQDKPVWTRCCSSPTDDLNWNGFRVQAEADCLWQVSSQGSRLSRTVCQDLAVYPCAPHVRMPLSQSKVAQTSFNDSTANALILAGRLQLLTSLLCSENSSLATAGSTGDCFEYLLKHDIVAALVQHCLTKDAQTQKALIKWLAELIASLNDTFLAHNSIHRPLIRLLRSYMASGTEAFMPDPSLEYELVDLLCNICSRIKHFPDLLIIFFRPAVFPAPDPTERVISPTPTHSSSASWQSQARPAECLLFSCLLCFVHREGAIGDLARTPLLLLVEVAFTAHGSTPTKRVESEGTKTQEISLLFAEWLLDSDLAEVVGAGLAALYGILPSKLHTPLCTLSGLPDGSPSSSGSNLTLDAIDLKEAEIQSAVNNYLSLFTFAENVLLISQSCSRSDREKALVAGMLSEAMVQAINTLFTDNVLYLGLLESSVEDGSAFAALTYLERLFFTLTPQGTVPCSILDNLLRENVSPEPTHSTPRKDAKVRRRKSKAMLTLEASSSGANKADHLDLDSSRPFSLRDMLMQTLRCSLDSEIGQLTQRACFTLLTALLLRHQSIASALFDEVRLNRLPHFKLLAGSTPEPDKEDDDIFFYPGSISKTPSVAECLLQRVEAIESLRRLGDSLQSPKGRVHQSACDYDRYLSSTLDLLSINLKAREGEVVHARASVVSIQRCPLLKRFTQSLSTFFLHHSSVNLKLTACITLLATNPYYLIDDWFSEASGSISKGELRVVGMLERLVAQVSEMRQSTPSFDQFLSERRRSLVLADDLADALVEDNSFQKPKRPSSFGRASGQAFAVAASQNENPFADHYAQTASLKVVLPSFTTAFADKTEISLSSVLDSTIILEEFVKEVASVLQMRLACGIDAVSA